MFAWGARTYVFGVVNCSPDSFSGDGHTTAAAAIAHGRRLVDEGADAIDVGGESTRPGAPRVPEAEELRRVLPVIEALAAQTKVPLSVDTSRATVAAAALRAGATVVNDVRAFLGDPQIAAVIAAHGAHVILMDNRLAPRSAPVDAGALGTPGAPGTPGVTSDPGKGGDRSEFAPRVPDDPRGERIVPAVADWLGERVAAALTAGIPRAHLIVDPGLGFGKTTVQSLALLRHLSALRGHPALSDLPLLVGPSRKGFLGRVLGAPADQRADQRLEGTLAAVALAIAGGADAVRVHDVEAVVRCCRVADAIARPGVP